MNKVYRDTVKINEIIILNRLSSIDEEVVLKLMSSIKAGTLINNITINQDNELISGLQRIEAYKRLKIAEIPYSLIHTTSDDEKLLLEIDENLVRKKLHYLDFARQLTLQKELYEKLYPETMHGKNRGKNSKDSFVETKKKQLNKSKSSISNLIKIGKLDKNIQDRIRKLDISQTDCIKLCKEKNIDERLDDIEFTSKTVNDVISKVRKDNDSRISIVTPLVSTKITESEKKISLIEKIDLMQSIDIEYYYNENKKIGYDIVKRNDFLQYHYFSQDYKVLETSQVICLITITYNGLKEYIGFISLNSPSLDKKFRNQFFGNRFFIKIYKMYKDIKLLNISRIVVLPSYRGLGLTKKLQKRISDDLFSNALENFTDVLYIEINSIMLHNFDFVDDSFNKTFLNLKNTLSIEDYFEFFKGKNDKNAQGYKEGTSLISNIAFRFNEKYLYVLREYVEKYLYVKVKDKDVKLLLNEVNNRDFRGTKKALILENIENNHEIAA